MFTEGLDSNALRWVRHENHKAAAPAPPLSQSSIHSLTNNARRFPLPSPSKFRSGHLPPTAIPLSRTPSHTLLTSSDDDSDEPTSTHQTYANAVPRYYYYATDVDVDDDDGDDVDDDDVGSDSVASSEFSTTHPGSTSVSSVLPPTRLRVSQGGYASSSSTSVPSQPTNLHNHDDHDDDDDDDVLPTAPPFSASAHEIRETPQIPSGADHNSTRQNTGGINNPHQFLRTTTAAEAAMPPCGSNPPRLPTFHASAFGPWHAVIAYDGCVRLCLHAWAKGCVEAPVFLENECALLREAFGVQNVLLQSEDELLAKRSSEVGDTVAPKHKQIVGKMKVQVRRVKTVLDPPTGCSMSSLTLRAPKLNIDSVQYHLSKMHSTLCTAWRSLRKIHVAPRIPANGSFSRQSLAYVHASTRYIKQVSGLLKTGVTSLRNSSASYEVVQETYSCLLRLKSSAEEDAIRMQPGSGESHMFFPDSLGDDLIVEVQDSKGKNYGCVLAQVATIAEDAVKSVEP